MSLLNQVRKAIRQHQLISFGGLVVMGVSGGPDSLALLHVLRELAPELGVSLHVAHLNHQLRGAESDADAAFVADLARELHLPATVQALDVTGYARENRLSLEEAARVVRYRFLAGVAAQIGSHTVAVAHNANDQVETILMHFLRGAGLAGLRGMEYKSQITNYASRVVPSEPSLYLVRPLLDVPRTEIDAYCRDHGLQPRLDSSNQDLTMYRNRLRHEVIPYLEQLNPNLSKVLRNSARTIAGDYEYLNVQMEEAFARVARYVNGTYIFDRRAWSALHPGLQRATLREAVRRLRQGLRNVNWQHIEDARRVALEGATGTEATLPQGLRLVVSYQEITIGEALPFPDLPLLHGSIVMLRAGSATQLPESDWSVRVENGKGAPDVARWTAVMDADKIRGEMVLRPRRAGERFQPVGLSGRHKSLHEFMIDAKIPRHVRDLLPILADDEKILWICGHRIDERVTVTEATKRVVNVEFFKHTATG